MARSADVREAWTTRFRVVTVVASSIGMAGIVLHIAANAIFAGGRVYAEGREMWRPIVDYPVLEVPSWFVIALAVVGSAALLGMAIVVRHERIIELIRPFGFALVGLCAFGFGMASAFRATVVTGPGETDHPLGLHWIGGAIALATLLLVAVIATPKIRRYDRERAARIAAMLDPKDPTS